MQDNQETRSRKNLRRIVFISCVAIVAILIALLFQGTHSERPAAGKEEIRQTYNDGTIQLIHLLEEKLAEATTQANDHTAIELERQVEDLKDILASRDEEREEFENKIQELDEELETTKKMYADLKQINLPVVELKTKLEEAQKALTKKDEILHANMEIEELRKQEMQDRIASLVKELESAVRYKEENENLVAALEENADTIESLQRKVDQKDEMFQRNLALEEKNKQALRDEIASLKKNDEAFKLQLESLQNEIHDKNEIIKTLAAFEDRYKEEKKKRLIKEQVVDQLQAALNEQRDSLAKMEKARQDLSYQLNQTQQTYSELMGHMASRKQTPEFSAVPADVEYRTHIVQQGETLMKISEKYYGTARKWKRILEANHDFINDQNRIKPGTILTIP